MVSFNHSNLDPSRQFDGSQDYILRHLPVLIYNSTNNGDDDDDDDDDDDEDDNNKHITGGQTINCLYFDNDHFDLYNHKLTKLNNSSTVRIRW